MLRADTGVIAKQGSDSNMPWYVYLLQILGGAVLVNGVPHFVQGVSGHCFQTPFAKPPGVGESPPAVNFVWGFCNLAAGAALLVGFPPAGIGSLVALAFGILVAGLALAVHFGKVRNEGRAD